MFLSIDALYKIVNIFKYGRNFLEKLSEQCFHILNRTAFPVDFSAMSRLPRRFEKTMF